MQSSITVLACTVFKIITVTVASICSYSVLNICVNNIKFKTLFWLPTLIVLVLGDLQICCLGLNLVHFHTTVPSFPLIDWDKGLNIPSTANSFNTCTVIANNDAST